MKRMVISKLWLKIQILLIVTALLFTLLPASPALAEEAPAVQWVRQFGGAFPPPPPPADYVYDQAIDAQGNIYVAGVTSGAFTGHTSSGAADAFVRKYDASGSEV